MCGKLGRARSIITLQMKQREIKTREFLKDLFVAEISQLRGGRKCIKRYLKYFQAISRESIGSIQNRQ